MKPVVVTFVDDKMLPLAEEQAKNAANFGLDHEIIKLGTVDSYDTALWLDLVDKTMEAISKHGKIMRLDAEVRLVKPLPQSWIDNDNVLFQPWPIAKDPFYIAINTGQIVLAESGLEFLRVLKECMLAMIPPDGDTTLPRSGTNHHIEDEWPSCIAIRLSGIRYLQEMLCHDRRLAANCAANRGLWTEQGTILTHPALHNWDWVGAGLSVVEGKFDHAAFINHFGPNRTLKEVEFIAKLLLAKNSKSDLWNGFASRISEEEWMLDDWSFIPSLGLVKPLSASLHKVIFSQPHQIVSKA